MRGLTIAAFTGPIPVEVDAAYVESCTSQFSDERIIGHGSMGIVYRSVDPFLAKRFVVKRMPHDQANDQAMVNKSLQREIDVLSKFQHPNIIRLVFVFI